MQHLIEIVEREGFILAVTSAEAVKTLEDAIESLEERQEKELEERSQELERVRY